MRTPRNDAQGYGFIVEYFTKYNKTPSFQKIADHMRYVSKQSVTRMIVRLSVAGFVKMENRSTQLVDRGNIRQAAENAQSLIHNIAVHVGAMASQEFHGGTMTQLAPKPKTRREILDGEIEWFQSLLDSLRDGEIESAIEAVEAWLKLMRRQREKL